MTDLDLFSSVVAHMQTGESYYHAMGYALRHGPGPAGSVFNWRPPLLYLLLSWWPWTVPDGLLLTEVWSGLAMAGSSLTAKRHAKISIVLAGLAVLFRELAVLYLLIRLLFGWKTETRLWLVMLWLIAVYYAGHWTMVLASQLPTDTMGPSWIAFGGLPFVLATFPGNGWLWLVGVLAMLACPALNRADRLTVAAYLLTFLVVGQYDPPRHTNAYWGYLVLPLQAVLMWQALIAYTDSAFAIHSTKGSAHV